MMALVKSLIVYGCTDAAYVEYNEEANIDNGTCLTFGYYGCTNPTYLEYNPNANLDDGSCIKTCGIWLYK